MAELGSDGEAMIRAGDYISGVEGVSFERTGGGTVTLGEVWDGKPLVLCVLRHLG